jgi:hypothetical protein
MMPSSFSMKVFMLVPFKGQLIQQLKVYVSKNLGTIIIFNSTDEYLNQGGGSC